jgi:hypothetical protein
MIPPALAPYLVQEPYSCILGKYSLNGAYTVLTWERRLPAGKKAMGQSRQDGGAPRIEMPCSDDLLFLPIFTSLYRISPANGKRQDRLSAPLFPVN